MKKKSIILSLALTLVVGVGATTYASTNSPSEGKGYNCGLNSGNGTQLRGYDILVNLLNSKGITNDEIDSAKTNDQSLHELANEKGISDEEIKEYMVNERIENIDALVASGEITAEDGEEAKTNITENAANCTGEGNSNSNKGSMNGNNRGKMGMNQKGYCKNVN